MLQAFVITLREGLEAFLIIGISLAYLRKSGRRELIPAVHWGIGLSVLLSIGAAYLFQQASNQALWEGMLALAAAVSVATLTVHMWRTAKKIKSEIEGHLRESTEKTGTAAWLGVFLFTLLMISREGMETALLMGTLLTQVQAMSILGGAIAGTLAAAGVAMLWSRYGHRVNLGLFFQVTAIFLLVFVGAAADLRLPRADRSQPVPEQRSAALGHRAVRARRRLRSIPDLPAGRRCPWAGCCSRC